jgi:hypothetical protein
MARLKAKWLDGSISGIDFKEEVPSGTVNGVNTTFTLSSTPADIVLVTLNSRPLKQTIDYTLSGVTLTLATAPAVGQELYALYY